MSAPLLDIRELRVRVEQKEILSGLSLEVRAGEVHAIMGRTAPARAHWRRRWRAATATRSPAAACGWKARICWK